MSSATICGCGIPFQVRASKSGEHPRCPMCGRTLKIAPRPVEDRRERDSALLAKLKIGVGVASLVGLLLLAIVLLSPGILTPRPTAQANPPASAEATPPSIASDAIATSSSGSGGLDGTMVPTGRIESGVGR